LVPPLSSLSLSRSLPPPPPPSWVAHLPGCTHAHTAQLAVKCGAFKFAGMCATQEGCQWCNNTHGHLHGAVGEECVGAAETCASLAVPAKMAALGLKLTSSESEVLRLMAESKSAPTAGDRVERSPSTQQKLQGLFVRPCQQYGHTSSGDAISEFDTRRYNSCVGAETCTYELDRTYYVGDSHCVPNVRCLYVCVAELVLREVGIISHDGWLASKDKQA
jgi:hypothetical protein